MTYKLRFLYILLSLSLKDNQMWFIKLIIIHILSYFPNLCDFFKFSPQRTSTDFSNICICENFIKVPCNISQKF